MWRKIKVIVKENSGSSNTQFQVIRKFNTGLDFIHWELMGLKTGVEKRWSGLSQEHRFREAACYYIMIKDYEDKHLSDITRTHELSTITSGMYTKTISSVNIDFSWHKVIVSIQTTRGHCSSVGKNNNIWLHITAVIIKLQILLFPTIIQLTEQNMLPVKCRGWKTNLKVLY